MRFSDWQRQMVAELGARSMPQLKSLWDASQRVYRSAENGQMWQHLPGEREAASATLTSQRPSASALRRLAEPDPDPELVRQGVVPPRNPKGYSTWYEMALDVADFRRSRKGHFQRANEALAADFRANPRFAMEMERRNPGIINHVSSGSDSAPNGFTWEHASSTTAHGRLGIMRLVPREQHTSGSRWWRIFHPDWGAEGGYNEWALPFGAPRNR